MVKNSILVLLPLLATLGCNWHDDPIVTHDSGVTTVVVDTTEEIGHTTEPEVIETTESVDQTTTVIVDTTEVTDSGVDSSLTDESVDSSVSDVTSDETSSPVVPPTSDVPETTVVIEPTFDAATSTLTDGLVLHLAFDESFTSTTVALDSSGLGNDGQTVGNVSSNVGKFGNAAVFDGSSWIAVADDVSLNPSDALSVSVWFNATTLPVGAAPGLVSKRVAFQQENAYSLFLYDGAKVYVDLDSTQDRFSTMASFSTSEWHNVVMTFDGSLPVVERVKVYVDGTLDTVAPESSTTLSASSASLEIGRLVGGGNGFVGAVDDVGVWNKALTQDQVSEIQLSPITQ